MTHPPKFVHRFPQIDKHYPDLTIILANLNCTVEHFNFAPSSDNFSLYPSAASALDDIHLPF